MSLESRLLEALQPCRGAPRWHVAFSGGLDSTVLLYLLVQLSAREKLPPIGAIHIHHGLQTVADGWPARCRSVCEQLGVELQIISVQIAAGPSLERAAREARYAAFTEILGQGETLLTAQHRDDQAETMLFRLLRGAGVLGLASIPADRALGAGRLVRPLLGVGRDELEAYAREQGLDWIEDPSNQCLDHSRNYLRHQVLPVIRQRWPRASVSMARAAAHLGEAQALLGELAAVDLQAAQACPSLQWLPIPSLSLHSLKALGPARQRNALRHWLGPFTTLPDTDHWAGWDALRDAAADAAPIWRLATGELHRGDGYIWWLSGPWLAAPADIVEWLQPDMNLPLPNNGSLRLAGDCGAGDLQVRYRQGGESLRLPGRGKRDLKRLLNEVGVPVFLRSRLPLLYRDDELIAVANLPQFDTEGLSLIWKPPVTPSLS
ncbi:tRNA lysidine(34) synthetase TilS [Pseudomonas stutzeri]|uniref:tRNA lysidine(34) synthetase TilS n=1 Tax=Stutzerimonas stutzeri TaxID=316 RepID=UPI00210EFC8B|nr:tRNA lysidine(34) synthetase TilS [Stutzerimonas stutzeri]MCQ4312067.1 tRNA lysidine(34) synthetase TilS [Stutzerimonas stutzeri]